MQALIQSLPQKSHGRSLADSTAKNAGNAVDESDTADRTIEDSAARRFNALTAIPGQIALSPNPISLQGGLWLELANTGPMQLIRAIIYKSNGKALVTKGFVLPQGKSSFFWSLDNLRWPKGTYELLIKSEQQLLRRTLIM